MKLYIVTLLYSTGSTVQVGPFKTYRGASKFMQRFRSDIARLCPENQMPVFGIRPDKATLKEWLAA